MSQKSQLSLFDNPSEGDKLSEKFASSLLLSAAGDALGWPLEFTKKRREKIEFFIQWKKYVGGKWWGYEEEIAPGEYSDDTQLTLSVARSIESNGRFNALNFAYLELPLWLDYERGGGRSIKSAAKNLWKKNTSWFKNFYKTKEACYFDAGTNGAAMRNLPIALVNMNKEENFIIDTIRNSLITNGHPRAIIGSLLIGAAQIYLLKNEINNSFDQFFDYIYYILDKTSQMLHSPQKNKDISKWLKEITKKYNFFEVFKTILEEAIEYIKKIPDFLCKNDDEYYSYVKANTPSRKGSGTSTTCAAIYMFLKHLDNPDKSLINAANYVGTDTDTIAGFVGSLIGAHFGASITQKLNELKEHVQDKEYILNIAKKLWEINRVNAKGQENEQKNEKQYKKLRLRWTKKFRKGLVKSKEIIHPALGKGTVEEVIPKSIPKRTDYVVRVFKVKFDCGQTVYFHIRKKARKEN